MTRGPAPVRWRHAGFKERSFSAHRRKRFHVRLHRGPADIVAWGLALAVGTFGTAGLSPLRAVAAADETPQAQPSRYNSKGRRDPFIPLVKDGQLVNVGWSMILGDRPVLYGILWDPGGHSLALINDTEVTVGDMVNGYRVAEIRQDAVVLTVEGGAPVVLQIDFEVPPEPSPGHRNGR